MTNEEFCGHLMAALHGPRGREIAARVLELAGEEVQSRSGSSDALDQLVENFSDLHRYCVLLASLHVVGERMRSTAGKCNVQRIVQLSSSKTAMTVMLKEQLSKDLGLLPDSAKEVLERLGLDK